jgi:hypothetical protein
MDCKYCGKKDITEHVFITRLSKLMESNGTCASCMYYFGVAEMLTVDPYRFMIIDGVIYEINKELDISGNLMYFKFNNGKTVKDYASRVVIAHQYKVPDNLKKILPDNCKRIKGNTKIKRKLPTWIKIKGDS